MKKIFLIIAIFIGALNAYTQNTDYVELKNDVLKIGKKISGNGLYNKRGTKLIHHAYIELYSDGNSKEYMLKVAVETVTGEPHIFANNTKLFIYPSNGSTLSLESVIRSHYPYAEGIDMKSAGAKTCKSEAYFSIPEEDLILLWYKKKLQANLALMTVAESGELDLFYWPIKLDGNAIKEFIIYLDENLEQILKEQS